MVDFKKVGKITRLKVILGYRNLCNLQQESLEEQGVFKEDFPCPDSEQFFAFEGSIFSEHKDCIPVTRFNCTRVMSTTYLFKGGGMLLILKKATFTYNR